MCLISGAKRKSRLSQATLRNAWKAFLNTLLTAQRLFERDWNEFIGLPSRLSAEAPVRSERERLLTRVTTHGFINDYSGIRISRSGHRFRIQRATVWNVSDAAHHHLGQAAAFSNWEPCH
jgi:hypothetical protein